MAVEQKTGSDDAQTQQHPPPPDAPALDSVSCPERITWLEGTEASLSCVAHGVPPPTVSCVRSGAAEVIEGLLHVAREHAGTYRCEATNSRGSAAKTVAITVECERGQQGAREGLFGQLGSDFQSLRDSLLPRWPQF